MPCLRPRTQDMEQIQTKRIIALQKAEEASMHLCRLQDVFGMVTDPLTTDAHIASLAIEYGYTVYSTDNDFKRLPEYVI